MAYRSAVHIFCCLWFLAAFPQAGSAQTPHEAGVRGLLPAKASVAGVALYSVAEGIPDSKKLGFAFETYTYEDSDAVALLVLPRHADSEVRLYRLTYDESRDFQVTREERPLYSKVMPANTVFWLYLNIPDTMPRLRLCMAAGGKEHCFTPFLSGEDGSLVVEDGFVEVQPIQQ